MLRDMIAALSTLAPKGAPGVFHCAGKGSGLVLTDPLFRPRSMSSYLSQFVIRYLIRFWIFLG